MQGRAGACPSCLSRMSAPPPRPSPPAPVQAPVPIIRRSSPPPPSQDQKFFAFSTSKPFLLVRAILSKCNWMDELPDLVSLHGPVLPTFYLFTPSRIWKYLWPQGISRQPEPLPSNTLCHSGYLFRVPCLTPSLYLVLLHLTCSW